ncbi:hypothetical protein BDW72DRAFT_186959 [Aspergillus terricola var. indicus]
MSTDSSTTYQAGAARVGIAGEPYTDLVQVVSEPRPLLRRVRRQPGRLAHCTGQCYFTKQGIYIVENRTSGQSVTMTVRAPKIKATLQGVNVESVIEDFQSKTA